MRNNAHITAHITAQRRDHVSPAGWVSLHIVGDIVFYCITHITAHITALYRVQRVVGTLHIFIYVYVYTYVCIYIYIYTRRCIFEYLYMYTYIHTHIYTYVFIYKFVYTYVSVCSTPIVLHIYTRGTCMYNTL